MKNVEFMKSLEGGGEQVEDEVRLQWRLCPY